MVHDPKRPAQDIAGVSGGGLEADRDVLDSSEPVTRDVADDRAPRKRVRNLNDKEVAPANDPTRTVTGDGDTE
jgi:hypothetical protein